DDVNRRNRKRRPPPRLAGLSVRAPRFQTARRQAGTARIGPIPALAPRGHSTQKCWPWITSVNTGELLGASASLPRYTAVSRCVPRPRLVCVNAGMVTENWPSVTGALAMAALFPSGPASNMTTVPEALGETTPEKLSGVSGESKALAGSWVAEGEVKTI